MAWTGSLLVVLAAAGCAEQGSSAAATGLPYDASYEYFENGLSAGWLNWTISLQAVTVVDETLAEREALIVGYLQTLGNESIRHALLVDKKTGEEIISVSGCIFLDRDPTCQTRGDSYATDFLAPGSGVYFGSLVAQRLHGAGRTAVDLGGGVQRHVTVSDEGGVLAVEPEPRPFIQRARLFCNAAEDPVRFDVALGLVRDCTATFSPDVRASLAHTSAGRVTFSGTAGAGWCDTSQPPFGTPVAVQDVVPPASAGVAGLGFSLEEAVEAARSTSSGLREYFRAHPDAVIAAAVPASESGDMTRSASSYELKFAAAPDAGYRIVVSKSEIRPAAGILPPSYAIEEEGPTGVDRLSGALILRPSHLVPMKAAVDHAQALVGLPVWKVDVDYRTTTSPAGETLGSYGYRVIFRDGELLPGTLTIDGGTGCLASIRFGKEHWSNIVMRGESPTTP